MLIDIGLNDKPCRNIKINAAQIGANVSKVYCSSQRPVCCATWKVYEKVMLRPAGPDIVRIFLLLLEMT